VTLAKRSIDIRQVAQPYGVDHCTACRSWNHSVRADDFYYFSGGMFYPVVIFLLVLVVFTLLVFSFVLCTTFHQLLT